MNKFVAVDMTKCLSVIWFIKFVLYDYVSLRVIIFMIHFFRYTFGTVRLEDGQVVLYV